jgi:carbonic anhydrase
MRALLSTESLDHLPAVKAWCAHAEATRRIVRQKYSDLTGDELAVAATEENVLVQMNNLSTHPSVAARLVSGELQMFGWYYDIGGGQILQYDPAQGRFADMHGQSRTAHPSRMVPPPPGPRLALSANGRKR